MKNEIKEIFLKQGADICGVANIDLFGDTPEGFRPTDIYSDCKSVIVFAKAVPKGAALVGSRIVYMHYNELTEAELDRIAFRAANEIEKTFRGAIAVPLPADNPYDYWEAENTKGHGILSMKHAAVRAGIGALGKSTILLNSRYGNMIDLCAVLTNLDLPSDPPAENICLENCHLCVDNCPVNAIHENSVNQKLCRKNSYGVNDRGFSVVNCNRCRVKCPMVFGKTKN